LRGINGDDTYDLRTAMGLGRARVPIEAGQQLLHYRLIEKIGEGGMGVVWKAVDTTLDREVALKVLPPGLADDEQRLIRFEREARLLASLSHPHIAVLHGLHQSEDVRFLTMELVEGEDLLERLRRGPMTLDETLHVGLQIAEALEAAHRQGVIHRDLKPANIKLTADGKAKVLDFGLAKALYDEPPASSDLADSPTMTAAATRDGVLLGTPGYMAPEQVRNTSVDARADVWAFGVVLYEMLTASRTFPGDTVSDTLAKVLERQPEWKRLPDGLPDTFRRMLRRCLIKDVAKRLQAIGEARIVIQELLTDPTAPTAEDERPEGRERPVWMRTLPWLLVPLALVAGWMFRPRTLNEPLPTVRFTIPAPDGHRIVHSFRNGLALSPDGKSLAFRAALPSEGEERGAGELPRYEGFGIWSRALDQEEARLIQGTEGFGMPVYSPDGRWLAMTERSSIKKVRTTGGEPITVHQGPAAFGMTWAGNDSIVFADEEDTRLNRVDASGGKLEPITQLDETKNEVSHRLPHALPDGDTILFVSVVGGAHLLADATSLEAVSLTTRERKVLARGVQDVRYSATGHLLLVREGRLLAAPFDAGRVEISGPEVPLVEGLVHSMYCAWSGWDTGAAQLAVAGSGLLAYLSGSVCPEFKGQRVWVDRDGNEEPIGIEDSMALGSRVSPDGSRLLVGNFYAPRASTWIYDFDRDAVRRQTFTGLPFNPVWGPGPDHLTYARATADGRAIVIKRVDSGPEEFEVLVDETELWPGAWTSDGQHLAAVLGYEDVVILSRDGQIDPFLDTRFREVFPDFSPDGKWLVYTSDESGREEVYVRGYPDGDDAVQVSRGAGRSPIWSRNGDEIFYRSGREFFAVRVRIEGERVDVGARTKLFEGDYADEYPIRGWDVAPDGRFVLTKPHDDEAVQAAADAMFPAEIHLIQNWMDALE
jgi:serine/threonine-protein kinase